MKKTLLTKFDRLMAAVTFAEAGEFSTAREFMQEGERSTERPAKRPEMSRKQTTRKSR